MDKLFKETNKNIKIHLAVETVVDPYEKNIILTYLNPFPIKAIVTDLTATSAQWKMNGIIVDKAKEIIIEKKYKSLIEKSRKIEIDNEMYEGWKQNGRMQIREEDNYLRIYCYIKQV